MQSIVVESTIEVKTAVIKHRKDWVEDRQTKKMKRVDVPISDRVKPSYHVRSYNTMVAGRTSRAKQFTLVFTEDHFKNKEITNKDETGKLTTEPFTFIDGMKHLFSNPAFIDNFNMRKAFLKVAPSNKETVLMLINEGLVKPEWIGNQKEFLEMARGQTTELFLDALKESVATVPKPAPTGSVLASKMLQNVATTPELTEQETETQAKLDAGEDEFSDEDLDLNSLESDGEGQEENNDESQDGSDEDTEKAE